MHRESLMEKRVSSAIRLEDGGDVGGHAADYLYGTIDCLPFSVSGQH